MSLRIVLSVRWHSIWCMMCMMSSELLFTNMITSRTVQHTVLQSAVFRDAGKSERISFLSPLLSLRTVVKAKLNTSCCISTPNSTKLVDSIISNSYIGALIELTWLSYRLQGAEEQAFSCPRSCVFQPYHTRACVVWWCVSCAGRKTIGPRPVTEVLLCFQHVYLFLALSLDNLHLNSGSGLHTPGIKRSVKY